MKTFFLLLLIGVSNILYSQTDGYAINNDRTKTYYRVYGSGNPLLIINGGPGMNSNGFEKLAQKLSVTNQVILYDQRGTGKSVLSKIDGTTITMDLMVSDMEAIRKKLHIQKWNILGHSFGGMLASYYATKHPETISKLILSSSGGVNLGLLSYVGNHIQSKLTATERDSLAYWNSKIAGGDTGFAVRLGRGRALAPAYLYHKEHVPLLAERLTQGNADINNLVWENLQQIKFDCAPKLIRFNQPVLIIQGKQDIIKPETAATAHRAFKNSKVVLLDDCGHYGWLDAAEKYFDSIGQFLKE